MLFFPMYFPKTELYLEPSLISKMRTFVKIVNGLMLFTIFTKSSILDIWLGSKNATKSYNKSLYEFNFFSFSSHFVKYLFLLLYKFLFLPAFKKDFQILIKTSIFAETNIYVKNLTMQISLCRQDKTLDKTRQDKSDNFKKKKQKRFIILIWRKLNIIFYRVF